MKNGLMKFSSLAAATLAFAAFSTPAAAFRDKLVYTFNSASGGPYCDGLTLTSTDKVAYQGFHVDSNCDGLNDPAGGLVVNLGGRKVIEVMTGMASVIPNLDLMFYIDPKSRTWYLYVNEFDLRGVCDYIELNSGVLIGRAQGAGRGGPSSLHAKPGVKLARLMGP